MFRVLSEDEAKKVTRWKAPELSSQAGQIAATRQEVLSRLTADSKTMQEDGRKARRVAPTSEHHTSAPALQNAFPGPSTKQAVTDIPNKTASIPMPHPSADMMQTSYDEGYTRGYEEGREKGIEEGQIKGFAEGNAALHQQNVAQLNTVIQKLETQNSYLSDAALEQEILQMTLDIARLAIRRELSLSPDALLGLVKAGLEQLSRTEQVTHQVHLHPLDAHIVREVTDPADSLEIVDDASLEQGACVVSCGSSTVQAGVEDWLAVAAVQLGIVPAVDDQADT